MEELCGKSMDLTEENINSLKQLFPEVFEEGKIDFDKLRLILGDEVDDNDERYEFTWHGKNNAIRIAQTPSTGTLIPDKESSKNWDDTENLYIEGDNLEVLKLLQKSYFAKVKMIYIDPPYNTGKDFVYHDDFRDNIANYKDTTNQTTKANPETNGRYHTDWLNMMYPRLKLANNLLTEDGFIFISINDYEVDNLKKICNEIFGENNFIAKYVWLKGKEGGNDSLGIGIHHEYILMYSKNMELACGTINLDKKDTSRHIRKDKEENLVKGILNNNREGELYQYINLTKQKDYIVHIPLKDGTIIESYSYAPQSTIDKYITEGKVFVGSKKVAYIKSYLNDEKNGSKPSSIIDSIYGTTKAGSIEIRKIMGNKDIFSYPKPSKLIKRLIEIGLGKDDIILDFFSGSSTTAHAVMQLNTEDKGKRKFIMVQLPELTDEKSEAHKAGYKNICEIGKERIRRAGYKIVSENKDKEGIENLDIGFKVFKLDSSNLKSWDSSIDNLEQNLLDMESNLKKDRTNEDLLYEILLKSGVELTAKIEEIKVGYNTLYNIGQGALLACLDDRITQDVIDEIPKHRSPFMDTKVIFKEAGFMSDAAKINAVQNLKQFKIEDVRSV